MSSSSGIHQNLYRLYEHYVGEPDESTDVYGYWLFIAGYILAVVGVIAFVVGYTGGAGEETLIRITGIVGGLGLALCLFGLVLMLPVRRIGVYASVVGLLIALAGVALFGWAYPDQWRDFGDADVMVITVYTAGVGLIALIAALVPIFTGRKGMFVKEEGATDDPAILTGDAMKGAQFAVFRDENGDWKWHVLHMEALAQSNESALTRPDAEEAIDRVQSSISSAGLMELTTSAFRLFEDRDGNWQWTLARDDGSVVGTCTGEFNRRDEAENSVSFLKDRGPDADVIEIEGAAFTYHEDQNQWYWQLVDDNRTPLASSDAGHQTQENAEEAAQAFAEQFGRARELDIDHIGVELLERSNGWTWRFVDDSDDVVATCSETFETRRNAESDVEALLPELESASVTVAGEPTYELYATEGQWNWRLVDESEHLVAQNSEPSTYREDVETQADQFSDHVIDADVVEIGDAEYEVYPSDEREAPGASADSAVALDEPEPKTDGGTATADPGSGDDWHWRLVTDDREVVAASTEPHPDSESATDAIHRVREQANEADLIEFEQSAFQVYEADTGEWRWRLIDEDGNVLADSGEEHASRNEASKAMMTLKEQAPDAELLEIETAAFELFVNEDDEWGWRLIDEGGKLVAEDPNTHPTRDDAREAMERLLDHLDSNIRTMDEAIFQAYAAGEWNWQFVLPSGEIVAKNVEEHPTRDELVDSVDDIRESAASAQQHTIGDVAVQLYDTGEWHWRLLDRDREEIADSNVSYAERDAAVSGAETLKAHATDAPIFTIEDAAIWFENGDDWTWQLIDPEREVLGSAVEPASTKDAMESDIEEVRQLAPMAGRVDFDVASFELIADEDDRWRWRLIDEDGSTIAAGTETHDSSESAREALEDVRDLIEKASILEIDSVSFELHTAEDGWVWQLVDEYGSTMAESTQTYESRTEAREAMNDVKSQAPDGWITFTE